MSNIDNKYNHFNVLLKDDIPNKKLPQDIIFSEDNIVMIDSNSNEINFKDIYQLDTKERFNSINKLEDKLYYIKETNELYGRFYSENILLNPYNRISDNTWYLFAKVNLYDFNKNPITIDQTNSFNIKDFYICGVSDSEISISDTPIINDNVLIRLHSENNVNIQLRYKNDFNNPNINLSYNLEYETNERNISPIDIIEEYNNVKNIELNMYWAIYILNFDIKINKPNLTGPSPYSSKLNPFKYFGDTNICKLKILCLKEGILEEDFDLSSYGYIAKNFFHVNEDSPLKVLFSFSDQSFSDKFYHYKNSGLDNWYTIYDSEKMKEISSLDNILALKGIANAPSLYLYEKVDISSYVPTLQLSSPPNTNGGWQAKDNIRIFGTDNIIHKPWRNPNMPYHRFTRFEVQIGNSIKPIIFTESEGSIVLNVGEYFVGIGYGYKEIKLRAVYEYDNDSGGITYEYTNYNIKTFLYTSIIQESRYNLTLTGPYSWIYIPEKVGYFISYVYFNTPPVSGHNSRNDYAEIQVATNISSYKRVKFYGTNNGASITYNNTNMEYVRGRCCYYTDHKCMYNKSNITVIARYEAIYKK